VSALPLRLSLEPVLASRTPGDSECFEYGFRLRLPGGLAVERNDPLLPAYGARVAMLTVEPEHEEALQGGEFDPGRFTVLMPEPFDPSAADAIGVWDADSVRQAGTLMPNVAPVFSAALEQGLEPRALVLTEDRAASDDRREGLDLLVFSPSLLEVDVRPASSYERPVRRRRPRLVLVADRSGEIRWWDPSASRGPLEAEDLPMSQELKRDLQRLREASAEQRAQTEPGARGIEGIEADWDRQRLEAQAATLWRRARAELGGRYAVGFLGAGMRRPAWTPDDLEEEESEGDFEIPF